MDDTVEDLLAAGVYSEPTPDEEAMYQEAVAWTNTWGGETAGYTLDQVPAFLRHDPAVLEEIFPSGVSVASHDGMYIHALNTVSVAPGADTERVVAHEVAHALQRQHLPENVETPAFQTEGFAWWLGKHHGVVERYFAGDAPGIAIGDLDDYTPEQLSALLPRYVGSVVYDAYEGTGGCDAAVREAMEPFQEPYRGVQEVIGRADRAPEHPDLVEHYLSELADQEQ